MELVGSAFVAVVSILKAWAFLARIRAKGCTCLAKLDVSFCVQSEFEPNRMPFDKVGTFYSNYLCFSKEPTMLHEAACSSQPSPCKTLCFHKQIITEASHNQATVVQTRTQRKYRHEPITKSWDRLDVKASRLSASNSVTHASVV